MAKCTFHCQQPLPPVCLCCGGDATHYAKQTFVNSSPWLLWTAFLGTWYYNWIVLQIPLCNSHRNSIRYRWVGPFVFLVGGGLGIFVSWGIYSSIFGREASDAVAGWAGGGAAVLFVLFYAALLYVSFTRPHVSQVQQDWITLSRVSDRFAASILGYEASVLTADVVDDPAEHRGAGIPVEVSRDKSIGPTYACPISNRKSARGNWPVILTCCLLAPLIFFCGGGLGLAIYSFSETKEVWLTAQIKPNPFRGPGLVALEIEHLAKKPLSVEEEYIWVVEFGDQLLRPRRSSAAELSRDGATQIQVFNVNAQAIRIWIESAPSGSAPGRRISNIAQVSVE